ncbi:MAG: hypothetical protein ABI443_09610 [Chthoniobacterales bacterium]
MKFIITLFLLITSFTTARAQTCPMGMAPAKTAAIPTKTATALEKINAEFRNQYALARAENLTSLPLVIIVHTSEITWISHGKTQQVNIPMIHYTESKILLHAILGTYGVGSRLVRSGGTPSQWQDARKLCTNIDTALKLTAHTTLNAEDQVKIHNILLHLRDQVSSWIAAGSLTQKQLEQSLRPVRKDALAIVNEIALQHYHDLRNGFDTIRHSVSASDWKNALVVVVGGAAPCRNSVEAAAAISEFGRSALGERIFYSENIFDTPGALQFLAGLENDSRLSETFFANPHRMWRDLLGDKVKNKVGGSFSPEILK